MSIYEFLQKENPGLLEKFLRSKGCITTHNRQPQGDMCFVTLGERTEKNRTNELCDELFDENDKLKQNVKYWREQYYKMLNRTTQLECDVFGLLEQQTELIKKLKEIEK